MNAGCPLDPSVTVWKYTSNQLLKFIVDDALDPNGKALWRKRITLNAYPSPGFPFFYQAVALREPICAGIATTSLVVHFARWRWYEQLSEAERERWVRLAEIFGVLHEKTRKEVTSQTTHKWVWTEVRSTGWNVPEASVQSIPQPQQDPDTLDPLCAMPGGATEHPGWSSISVDEPTSRKTGPSLEQPACPSPIIASSFDFLASMRRHSI